MSQGLSPGHFNENAAQSPLQNRAMSFLSYPVAALIVAVIAFMQVPGLREMTKITGAMLAVFYIFYSLRFRTSLNAEVILYGIWVSWSLLGALASVQPDLFREMWLTLVQIWVFILIVSGHADSRKALSITFMAFLVGALIAGAASVLSGTYQSVVAEEERLTGLGMNANSFGRLLVYATACVMYFWVLPTRITMLKYIVLGGLLVLLGMGTILSGSRFAVLGLGLLYVLWIWFCYRKGAMQRPAMVMAILVIAAIGFYVFLSYSHSVAIGGRLEATWNTLTGHAHEGSTTLRLNLYRDSLNVLGQYPILGVGLGNFFLKTSVRGLSGHSDYIEVFCTTGVPGGLIYFSIFAVLWWRAGRIRRFTGDVVEHRVAGLIRAVVLVTLFVGVGQPNYYSKMPWVVLGGLIGYSNILWHTLRGQLTQPAAPVVREMPRFQM